jgi:hypothetical protein
LTNLPDTVTNADEIRRTIRTVFNFYIQLLGQIDAFHLGFAIQLEGLFIRSRLVPRADTHLDALVASIRPAQEGQLVFLDNGSLMSVASGNVALSAPLKQAFIKFYADMVTLSPASQTLTADERAAIIAQSMRALGAPTAFTCRQAPDGRALLIQGMLNVTNPAAYLDGQFDLMRKPAMQKLSGMAFTAPVKRAYKGVTVMTSRGSADEQAFKKTLRASLPPAIDPEDAEEALQAGMGMMKQIMQLFSNDFAYAATSGGVAFGMGSPTMIEQAITRLLAPPAASAEAVRIRKVLAPSAAPHSLGRLSLAGLMKLILSAMPPVDDGFPGDPAATAPEGEGVIFAGWRVNRELLTALLLPPSEIEAVKAQLPMMQMRAPGGK